MTDESGLQPQEGRGDTKMYRPSADGGLEVAPDSSADYRDQLRSRRWNAAPLENPEVEKTDPRIAVVAIAILSAITFIVIVAFGVWG